MNTSWSSPAHEAIGQFVRARTGLFFHSNRVTEAEAGIRRAMDKTHLADAASYLQRLEAGTADLDGLVTELTVTETYFFRDPGHFEFIRTQVLPALVRPSPGDQFVRVWSAGCASGEEAYSLAILLDEAGFADRTHVLATDISRTALAKAREASYRAWSFRGVDPNVVRRYFRAVGDRQVLDSRIRQRVHIEPLNLALDTYPSFANGTWRMDLILCRNVLMYFDHAGVRAVARRLWECLAHTGWLVTGPSDPSINEDGLYESVTTPAGVFYRRGRVAIPDAGAVVSSAGPSELEPQSTRALLELPTGALAAEVSAPSPMPPDVLADAKAAFERGDYGRAVDLARGLPEACAAALSVRALANARGPSEAERAASDAALRYPLAPEIHLLRGVVLMDMDRYEGAAKAAKRALYLDRTLAFGHFLLGLAVARLGDTEGARRAFRNAGELCACQGPDEIVAFCDGQRVGRFAEAVTTQLELLGGTKS